MLIILSSTLLSITGQDDAHLFLYANSQADSSLISIYIYDLDSEVSRPIGTLSNSWSDASWSPDGKYVLFTYDNEGDYRSAELYTVETADIIAVTNELSNNPCNASLHWSADDHFLAFSSPVDDKHRLDQILDLEQGDSFALPDLPPLYNYFPDWSPNGHNLVQTILIENQGFDMILWDMNQREVLAQLERHQTGEIEWSPDGRYFSYIADQNQDEVTIFDTFTLSSQTYASKDLGMWSPDSRYLSYRYEQTLFVLDIEEQITQEIAIHDKLSYLRDWSFDSQYLAYMIDDEQIGGIYAFDTALGISTRLTDNLPFTNNLVWSPTRHHIVYTQLLQDAYDNGLSNLNVYNLDDDTTITHQVSIPSIYFDRPLHWSPTGDHLALWAEDGIQLLSITNETLEHVNPSIPYTSLPRWSSDGEYLAYSSEGNIYVLDLKTGQTLTFDDDNLISFIGWRGTNKNTSLIHCGIG